MTTDPTDSPTLDHELTVFMKTQCVQCDATKKWLDDRKIPFNIADATTDENLALAAVFGIKQAPMVIQHQKGSFPSAGNGSVPPTVLTAFSGFRPDALAILYPADRFSVIVANDVLLSQLPEKTAEPDVETPSDTLDEEAIAA